MTLVVIGGEVYYKAQPAASERVQPKSAMREEKTEGPGAERPRDQEYQRSQKGRVIQEPTTPGKGSSPGGRCNRWIGG